ncbi:hypothetical protein [Bacteroides sp.]
MKSLEMNAGMQELSREEMVNIEGGNKVGDALKAIGKALEAAGELINALF